MMRIVLALPIAGLLMGQPASSQPAVRAADVASMDAIVAALYDVISGPKRARFGLGPHALALRPRRAFDSERGR